MDKLNEDEKHWAHEVQSHPIPRWPEAFEYAYKLGLERANEWQDIKTLPKEHEGLIDILVWNTTESGNGEEYHYRIADCFVDPDRWLVEHCHDQQISVYNLYVEVVAWMPQNLEPPKEDK